MFQLTLVNLTRSDVGLKVKVFDQLFNLKQIGAHKAEVGAGVEIFFLKTEPELEPKQIVSAPQNWTEGNSLKI